MGAIGKFLGHHAGGAFGFYSGKGLKRWTGVDENRGREIGEQVGSILGDALIPFKKGGKVKFTGAVLAHKGEFVLPKGVKPTKSQLKRVKKRGGCKRGC
jgi:hypothetical protein